ncbi:MAG: glutamate--tRNA ligase [bacterium]
MGARVRVRFAPSPTGYLHIGNARTALFNWLFAQNQKGNFILRIEDTDRERSSLASEETIKKDLEWLGLSWDEGPVTEGPFGPYRQSERTHIYREYVKKLIDKGYAYYCYCSAEELETQKQKALAQRRMPLYNGHCRNLTAHEIAEYKRQGREPVVRFRIPHLPDKRIIIEDIVRGAVEFEDTALGDFVLLRSDGSAAYNYAVVIDDALMDITHILRGEDHLSNTPKQILLYQAFGFPLPRFAHLSMILGPDHTRLSKRHGATSVTQYRERGFLPEALVNYLSLLGWSSEDGEEFLPIDELVRKFTLDRLNKSAAVFDTKKLLWLNGNYIRRKSLDSIAALSLAYIPEGTQDEWRQEIKRRGDEWWLKVVDSVKAKVDTVVQIYDRARVYFNPTIDIDADAHDILVMPEAQLVIEAALSVFSSIEMIAKENLREIVKEITRKSSVKGKSLYMIIRAALSGSVEGPDLDQLIILLGRDTCCARFHHAFDYIKGLDSDGTKSI